MDKIDTVRLTITTGATPTDSPVRMRFNGHEVAMQVDAGSTEAGATFRGSFQVLSVAHSVFLLGPESGAWEIERVVAEFDGPAPVTNEYGATTLEAGGQLDIWTAPTPTFDV